MAGSQDYAPDPRNADALVYVDGEMMCRGAAKVSVFDAGFALGDGVWEGLRLHKGRLLFLEEHLDRLFAGAGAIALDIGMDRDGLKAALRRTLAANQMTDGAHLRMMVTRGLKATVNQDPRNALGAATLVITAEYKTPVQGPGLKLAIVGVRCTPPTMFDMRLNSHSRLNLIIALLEAVRQGADEALMLDPSGFVSTCNATNFFFVRRGEVLTSSGAFCFNGITRRAVIDLCRTHGLPIRLEDFTLGDLGEAEEAFVTGTLGGLTAVREIDGAALPAPGPVTRRLVDLYESLKDIDAARHSPL